MVPYVNTHCNAFIGNGNDRGAIQKPNVTSHDIKNSPHKQRHFNLSLLKEDPVPITEITSTISAEPTLHASNAGEA